MKIKFIQLLFILALVGLTGFSSPYICIFPGFSSNTLYTKAWVRKEVKILKARTPTIDNKVLYLGLIAYSKASKKGYTVKPILTIIDYSKPSSKKRLWVFDLKHNQVLFNTWVAHGKNSGKTYATSFSNIEGSLKSSLGVFVTDNTYIGKNGYSLKIRGLENGVNNSAYERNIVVHGAKYTTPSRVGNSWGCPAVMKSIATPLINAIKQKSVIFAYYPDQKWLSNSSFL